MKIILSNKITLEYPPESMVRTLKKTLIIDNPKYIENEKFGYNNYNTPSKLSFIKNEEDFTHIPKGLFNRIIRYCKNTEIEYSVEDRTTGSCLDTLDISMRVNLYEYQHLPCEKILKKRFGVIQAPTGSGKTVMGLYIIVQRNIPTLIVVHTKKLLHQWKKRLLDLTDIDEEDVGLYGDGFKQIRPITIGIINSLNLSKEKFSNKFGQVIIDECHRTPSTTFTNFLARMNTKFMLGLSATPYRRDGLGEVINFYIGDTVHKIEHKKLQEEGHIMKADLKIIPTQFHRRVKSPGEYPTVIKELISNDDRNELIAEEVVEQYHQDKGVVLIISDRRKHCYELQEEIQKHSLKVCCLTSKTSKSEEKEIEVMLKTGTSRILVATIQLVGEGYDYVHLSSLFICTPIKYSGRLIQVIGRILRIVEGKETATIFDFSDPCWLLQNSLGKRMETYKELGIEMEEENESKT